MNKEQLLAYIVEHSAPNRNDNNPFGFCYISAGTENLATELHNEELIQAATAQRAQDGSYPVRPTDSGVKWVQANSFKAPAAAPQPAPTPASAPAAPAAAQHVPAPSNYAVQTGIPMPEKKAFGRATGGETLVDRYPFATMQINESFFVPQDNPPRRDDEGAEVPKHRSFSSVVSQANKKLHPKSFVIREYVEHMQGGSVAGARIWRTEDMQGERPVRARRKPKSETDAATQGAGAPQYGGQQYMPQPGQPFPGVPQSGYGTQYDPQGSFAGTAPAAAPAPGFPAPAPQPGGFPQPGMPAPGAFPGPQGGFPAPGAFQAPGGAPGFPGQPAADWSGAPPAGGPLPSFNG